MDSKHVVVFMAVIVAQMWSQHAHVEGSREPELAELVRHLHHKVSLLSASEDAASCSCTTVDGNLTVSGGFVNSVHLQNLEQKVLSLEATLTAVQNSLNAFVRSYGDQVLQGTLAVDTLVVGDWVLQQDEQGNLRVNTTGDSHNSSLAVPGGGIQLGTWSLRQDEHGNLRVNTTGDSHNSSLAVPAGGLQLGDWVFEQQGGDLRLDNQASSGASVGVRDWDLRQDQNGDLVISGARVQVPQGGSHNAPTYTVTVSSTEASTHRKENAVDGNNDTEWASFRQGVGAWIQLDWASGLNTVTSFQLYPRTNPCDQASQVKLIFSDGSEQGPFALNINAPSVVLIAPKATTSVRLEVVAMHSNTCNFGVRELSLGFQGSKYEKVPGGTWDQANAQCHILRRSLVTIHNSTEDAEVHSICGSLECFIGLYRQKTAPNGQDNFKWVDGSRSAYRNWNVNEPRDFEYRGMMRSDGKWNDIDFAWEGAGVCGPVLGANLRIQNAVVMEKWLTTPTVSADTLLRWTKP